MNAASVLGSMSPNRGATGGFSTPVRGTPYRSRVGLEQSPSAPEFVDGILPSHASRGMMSPSSAVGMTPGRPVPDGTSEVESEFCSPSAHGELQRSRGKPVCARNLTLEGDPEGLDNKHKESTGGWDAYGGDQEMRLGDTQRVVVHPETRRGNVERSITTSFPRVKPRRDTTPAGTGGQSPATGAGDDSDSEVPTTPPKSKGGRSLSRAHTAPPTATEAIPEPPIESWKEGRGGYVSNGMAMLIGTGHLAPAPTTPKRTPGPPLPQSGYEFSPGWMLSPFGRGQQGAGEFSPGFRMPPPSSHQAWDKQRGDHASQSDGAGTSDSGAASGSESGDEGEGPRSTRHRRSPSSSGRRNRRLATGDRQRRQEPASPLLTATMRQRHARHRLGRAVTEPIMASPAGLGGVAPDPPIALASPPRHDFFGAIQHLSAGQDDPVMLADRGLGAWNGASGSEEMAFLQTGRPRPRKAQPIMSGFPQRQRLDSIDSLPREEFSYVEAGAAATEDDDVGDRGAVQPSSSRRRRGKASTTDHIAPASVLSPGMDRQVSERNRATPMSRRRTPAVRARGLDHDDDEEQLPARTRKTPPSVRAVGGSFRSRAMSSPNSPAQTSRLVDPISDTPARAVPRALAGVVQPGVEAKRSSDPQFTREEAMQQVMEAVQRDSRPSDLPPCHCARSQCLKLYCECFATGAVCDPDQCKCAQCRNLPECKEDRTNAVKHVLRRNPKAFQSKISASWDQQQQEHVRGCRCRNSHCVKKYCECFRAGIVCSQKCVCVQCKNFVGSEALNKARSSAGVSPARSGGKTPSMGSPGGVATATMSANTPRRRRGRSAPDKGGIGSKRRRTGSPNAGGKVWVDDDDDGDE